MTRPLSAREVSDRLGVHVNTVKRTPPADLPYFTVGSRNDRRYRVADVHAYITARTVEGGLR